MSDVSSLQGKSAIVTGSGRGIGAATAIDLAIGGANVVVNYLHNAEAAAAVHRQIIDAGGTATVVQADVSTEDGARLLADAAYREYGRIDILVSNAGPLFRPIPLADMSWSDLGGIVNQDLQCAFFSTKAVLPTMIEQHYGRIVYIGSVSSAHPTRGLAHHSTARAAVTTFARAVATELGRHNITSNVVAPGMVRTDRTAAIDEMLTRIAATTPVGRVATPDDVARAVRFFAGDAEGFYTGVCMQVDGGLSD